MQPPSTRNGTSELVLSRALRAELVQLARLAEPREACGVLLGRREEDRVVLLGVRAARNLRVADGTMRFELDPGALVAITDEAGALGLEVVGVFHSHPRGPAVPSEADRAAAWEGWSYLIVGRADDGDELRSWRALAEGFREERVLESR